MASAVSHIGLCVTDLARSRRFYEEVFGFRSAFEFRTDGPETAQLLRLDPPLALEAAYLWLDGVLLELLALDRTEKTRSRVMNEPGLTHFSFFVDDMNGTLDAVGRCGGRVRADTNIGVAVFIEDPDGQMIEVIGPRGHFREVRDGAIRQLD